MKNRKIVWVGIVILAVVYFFLSPLITVAQMRSAADDRDGEALSEHVDFLSVRQSLKDQMNAMMAKEIASQSEENPFGALGMAFGGMFIEKMVDSYVTPSGLVQMMKGEAPSGKQSTGSPSNQKKPFNDASFSYKSMSRFDITVKDDNAKETKFILRRSGLSWKLSEIMLPI